jgi:hypothetical protein
VFARGGAETQRFFLEGVFFFARGVAETQRFFIVGCVFCTWRCGGFFLEDVYFNVMYKSNGADVL